MTAHDHAEIVPGCFRCELAVEEAIAAATGPEATAAVQRAAEAISDWDPHAEGTVTVVLAAALDVEEMARALFESVAENRDWDARSERIREYWRDYARAIRAAILGGAA